MDSGVYYHKTHYVFDSYTQFKNYYARHEIQFPGLFRGKWYDAEVGDWVRTDDDRILQILSSKEIGGKRFIRTIVGTYEAVPAQFLDSDFSNHPDPRMISRRDGTAVTRKTSKLKARDWDVAYLIARGFDQYEAAKLVYGSMFRPETVRHKLSRIFRDKEASQMIKDGVDEARHKIGLTDERVLKVLLTEAENPKNRGSERVSAAKELAKIVDLYPEEIPKLPASLPLAQIIEAKEVDALEAGNAQTRQIGSREGTQKLDGSIRTTVEDGSGQGSSETDDRGD